MLCLLGCGAILALVRLLTSPYSAVGELYRATGIPASVTLAAGFACVISIAFYAFWRSVTLAPRFRITDQGLYVRGALGAYTLEWRNIRSVGVTSTGALGLKVTERDAVVATHVGTSQQRDWLRTTAPYGEWDFLFLPAELGTPAEQVRDWLTEAAAEMQ